jgi:hypothetical protein
VITPPSSSFLPFLPSGGPDFSIVL